MYICTVYIRIIEIRTCTCSSEVIDLSLFSHVSFSFRYIHVHVCDTGGKDYEGRLFSMILDSSFSEPFAYVVITIKQDNMVETAETFNVTVTTSAEFAKISVRTAVVIIAGESGVYIIVYVFVHMPVCESASMRMCVCVTFIAIHC